MVLSSVKGDCLPPPIVGAGLPVRAVYLHTAIGQAGSYRSGLYLTAAAARDGTLRLLNNPDT